MPSFHCVKLLKRNHKMCSYVKLWYRNWIKITFLLQNIDNKQVSVAGSYHISMWLTLLLCSILVICVIGLCYNNITLFPPNSIYYIKYSYFSNIVRGVKQNGVPALSRGFRQFIVTYGASSIWHTKSWKWKLIWKYRILNGIFLRNMYW